MTFVEDLFHNPIAVAPALGWLVAQSLKSLLYTWLNKEFRKERLVGGGGMPSSHSATVCALCAVTAVKYGATGFYFPMTLFFAFIVMYDAMGVRRETGRQAEVINAMIDDIKMMTEGVTKVDSFEQLKVLIGHSPLQVLAGAILGIVIGLLVGIMM